jgi:tRNA(His) guanylyltransferase
MHNLEQRMKMYEEASRTVLPRRLPIIVRVDGKGFSNYTRQLPGRPFDRNFMSVMESTATTLCQEIQGAQLAFVQSDEVSVLVHGFKKFESEPWFGNQTQKMVSVSAAVAAATFTANSWRMWAKIAIHEEDPKPSFDDLEPAYFDSRVFVLPESDVVNYFLWRQRDGVRNSKQMFARQYFSHSELNKKTSDEIVEMCKAKGHDWHKLPASFRNGRCVRRVHETVDGTTRNHFKTDYDVPCFADNRQYIERFLMTEDDEQ